MKEQITLKNKIDISKLMNEGKIILINLSKGRLGDINANLIGMIIVGKILMAALSRVDDVTRSFPPFYLHIDEFQNVTTPAIASINIGAVDFSRPPTAGTFSTVCTMVSTT